MAGLLQRHGGTLRHRAEGSSPAVTFWDGVPEFEHLPPSHPELGWLTPELVAVGIAPRAKQIAEWCPLRKQHVLELVAFGASVTAGCGAHAPSHHCHPSGSWGHWLQVRLQAQLGDRYEVRIKIFGKNAITVDYFMQCPTRFGLSTNTSLVLLEFEGSALSMTDGTDNSAANQAAVNLKRALRSLRSLAPRAVYVFVGWPMKGRGKHLNTSVQRDFFLAAKVPEMEAVFSAPLLRRAAALGHLSSPHELSADMAHPNGKGAALLAELALTLITTRLSDREACGGPDPSDDKLEQFADASAVVPPPFQECFVSADRIPVAPLPVGITLRDEGGEKAVQKLGLVSDVPGGKLSIGPLASDVRCGLLAVSLGYLQSWRPGQGRFRIDCVGCQCFGQQGAWAAGADPFPIVDTWKSSVATGSARGPSEMNNATITVFTSFFLYKKAGPCWINVSHLQPDKREEARHTRKNYSRIRVDAVGLEMADCSANCRITKHPGAARTIAIAARVACTAGWKAKKVGYITPMCFNSSIRCVTGQGASQHPRHDLEDVAVDESVPSISLP